MKQKLKAVVRFFHWTEWILVLVAAVNIGHGTYMLADGDWSWGLDKLMIAAYALLAASALKLNRFGRDLVDQMLDMNTTLIEALSNSHAREVELRRDRAQAPWN